MQTGQKIAFLREKAGLTQEQLAEKLYVSRELVSKWETGRRRPDRKTISVMAVLFETDEDEISGPSRVLDELSACIPADADLSAGELTSVLNGFLGTLSQTERNVFISRYYHGMGSSETASALGLGESNVRKKLMLLRNKFTEYLREKQSNG